MSQDQAAPRPYAYSFDRTTFTGAFATREQAVEAGLRAVAEDDLPVDAVHVGKRVPTDPCADHHADTLVRAMRQRMLTRTGDAGYLRDANEHVQADLDAAVAATVVAWLRRHGLEPAARVTSISEHPLPSVRAHGPAAAGREVGPIGGEM